jgi:eukaryotic-like serine/threonine-protein kinase
MELGNRYRLIESVATGVYGEVFKGHDLKTGGEVAIKVLASGLLDRQTVARLRRELEIAASFRHPNLVEVYDYGTDGNRPYIVSEFVQGTKMPETVDDRTELRRILQIAADVVEGLTALHERRIIHGDLLPDNVLIAPGGTARLVEVGLYPVVQLTFRESGKKQLLTVRQDDTRWTMAHSAPEVVAGREADPRADQFALGVLLYELFTQSPLFYRPFETVGETYDAVLQSSPRPLCLQNAAIPAEVSNLVDRLLQKDPDARFESARELSHHLRRLEARLAPRVSTREGLRRELNETFSSDEAADRWLRTPNRVLDGERPIDLLERNDYESVGNALEALNTGVFV